MRLAVGLAILLGAGIAHADSDATLTVDLNDLGRQFASEFGYNEQELLDRLRAAVDDVYQTAHLDNLLRSFADTGAFSNRSLGVDYQPDPGDRSISVIGIGAISNDASLGSTSHLIGGVVANGAVVAGVDLARFGHPRWSVFANGFYEATTIHGLDGHLLTLGSHVQFRAIEATRSRPAWWSGLSVVSGLEVSRWTLGTETGPVDSHFTVLGTQPDQKKTVHVTATGPLQVIASTVTVPVELATGVRLGPLGLYVAGGIDLTTGSSTITADLDGVLSINQMDPIGNAHIVATGSHGPSPVSGHGLVGIALHTRHFRLFLQGSQATADKGVFLGMRAAW